MDSWFTPFDEHTAADDVQASGTVQHVEAAPPGGSVEPADSHGSAAAAAEPTKRRVSTVDFAERAQAAASVESADGPGMGQGHLIEVPTERWGRPAATRDPERARGGSANLTPLLRLPVDCGSDSTSAADADEVAAAPRVESAAGELAEVRNELFERVLRALRHRQRSRAEIERHMRELIAASEELELAPAEEESLVASIIDDLERLGYLNDEHLAEAVVRSSVERKKLGASAIRRELRQRGIDEKAAAAALEQLVDDDEAARALELARERAAKQSGLDPEALKRRLYGFLQRRGFSGPALSEAVSTAVREAQGAGLGSRRGLSAARRSPVRFDQEG